MDASVVHSLKSHGHTQMPCMLGDGMSLFEEKPDVETGVRPIVQKCPETEGNRWQTPEVTFGERPPEDVFTNMISSWCSQSDDASCLCCVLPCTLPLLSVHDVFLLCARTVDPQL